MDAEKIRHMLYYPDRLPPDLPPPPWAGSCEEVRILCEDGVAIHALWWDQPRDAPVILFLHGNAQEAYTWSLVRQDLEPLGCRMLLPDYHGYGKSGGEPAEESLYSDGRACLRWLEGRGVEGAATVVFGKSLGGAVACEIAQERELRALILESTFTSLASVARRLFPFLPAGTNLLERYASIEKIKGVRCPVLIIHGSQDELIPLDEGLALHHAAPSPKEFLLVEGAGHNDVALMAGPSYGQAIAAFLKRNPFRGGAAQPQ